MNTEQKHLNGQITVTMHLFGLKSENRFDLKPKLMTVYN